MDYKWHSIFRNSQNKVSSLEVGFLFWLIGVNFCWILLSLYHGQMENIPMPIIHLTLALGATKVTHRLMENNWSEVISNILKYLMSKQKQYD